MVLKRFSAGREDARVHPSSLCRFPPPTNLHVKEVLIGRAADQR